MENIKTETKTEQFLKHLSQILIWIFIIIIAIDGIIYFLNIDKLNYEIVNNQDKIGQTQYQHITSTEYHSMQQIWTRSQWVAIICIIGWMISNPDFRRGFKQLLNELKEIGGDNDEN